MNTDIRDRAVIFDIDGTLANNDHRQHYLEGDGKKDWKNFFKEMHKDTLHEDIMELLVLYADQGYKILLLTGRGAEYIEETQKWVTELGMKHYMEQLYMRPLKDYRKDTEIKAEIYHEMIKPRFDVRMIFDDRDSVVKMWRGLGLRCLQVANGNF